MARPPSQKISDLQMANTALERACNNTDRPRADNDAIIGHCKALIVLYLKDKRPVQVSSAARSSVVRGARS
jgi:hypothetical protein